jgi:hypothetical protein
MSHKTNSSIESAAIAENGASTFVGEHPNAATNRYEGFVFFGLKN